MEGPSFEITGYGSTFITTHRYSWRVPPDKRPRIVLDVLGGSHEVPLPWWLVRRLDPDLMEGVSGLASGFMPTGESDDEDATHE